MDQVTSKRFGHAWAEINPAAQAFLYLQILDVVSTLAGLRLGAIEGSPFVALLMRFGPTTGLVLSKIMAMLLGAACIYLNKRRVLRWATYWYAAVVLSNLLIVLAAVYRAHG